jgi:hypothetical protein
MTIEQTVEIHKNGIIHLDIALPPPYPIGAARFAFTITPADEPSTNPYEAIEQAAGFAKKLGSTLTVDRFLEMKREDLELEEAEYRRLFHHEDKK